MEAVRRRLAAGDALVVLAAGLDEVLWANGTGAALFGHSEIFSFIGVDPELPPAVRRQIGSTPGFPAIGSDRQVAVRLTSGVTSRVIAFAASSVTMPDGEQAILLAAADPAAPSRAREDNAARVISGLSGDGQFVALIDDRGTLLAASEGFSELGVVGETLRELADEVAGESDRLVKRLIPAGRPPLPAGIARLSDDPPVNLLMIVDESALEETAVPEASAKVAPAAEPALRGEADRAATAEPTIADVLVDAGGESISDAAVNAPSPTEQIATPAAEPERPAATSETAQEDTGTQNAAAAPSDVPARRMLISDDDGWYFNERPDAPAAKGGEATPRAREPQPEAKTVEAESRHAPASELAAMLRFVWRTDAEGRFSAISDEFRTAFGAEATDIVGKPFGEIARRFGLDPDGEIAGLLERRDTWSGRSVLWPVAGTDLKVPVDLAALPVYDRDRNFEGFRGFGVARMGDAVVDPDAIGLSLKPADDAAAAEPETPPAEGQAPEADAKEAAPAETVGEMRSPETETTAEAPAAPVADRPAAETAAPAPSAPTRPTPDKVIHLEERRTGNAARGLSAAERLNFREIGERLRNAGLVASEPSEPKRPASPADTAAPDSSMAAADAPASATPGAGTPGQAQRADPSRQVDDTTQADDDQNLPDVAEPIEPASEKQSDEATTAETAPADEPVQPATGTGPAQASVTAEPAQPTEPVEPVQAAGSADAAGAASPPEGEEAAFVTASEPASEAEPTAEPVPVWEPERARGAQDDADNRVLVPSAFGGAAADPAPAGLDAAVLSRLPLPLLVHAGDALFFANREFLQLTGYDSLEELDEAGGLGAIFGDPYQPDETAQRKLRLRTRDGVEFPVDAFLQSVAWKGRTALLLALKRAVEEPLSKEAQTTPAATQTSASQADLEARLEELRTIIDTATDGVVIIGNDRRIRSISRPAEALFGIDAFNVVGQPFTTLFAIESQKAAADYLAGLAENGVASVLNDGREVIGREAQGRFIPLFMTIGRLPHDSGFCAVLRDITHWKRVEEDLTEARAAAERASSSKTEFLARVSHEIRTPLNAIIGFSELMLDEKFGPIGNERYRDYLRDINKSGNHVLDLVNDLLDITKIEAGQQELSYEAVSLNETLSEAVAMMQPQANRERVIIRSSFASRLPDVVADLRSVRQIALNLLSNAIRYTPAGGQVIVSTAYEPSGDIVMRVRDTGIGMAEAEIEQALKPFKQINALKRPRGDGTGLGLPLTKAMVEANRARFAIHSAPGEGTLVEITFPSTRVLAH